MSFAENLIVWQRRHGRRDLPWQATRDPYRVWLSEVMLQQTQVSAVIPYYQRFLQKYPTVAALAAASEDEVLQLWSGLGYYARGRNLLRAAREVVGLGRFPERAEKISELPGIGRSTAAAIAVFAFGQRAAILDGNVKRVLSRVFGVEAERKLWALAERLLPKRDIEAYTQGLMDLGATVCTRIPDCTACPVKARCVARKTDRVAELPAPRRRKPLPLKNPTWCVYLNGGRVILDRRPTSGVWGGLWCFPEKPIVKAKRARKLAPIDHGFTHFRLRIEPVVYALARQPALGAGFGWMTLKDAARAAIPTPVRKLLQHSLQALEARAGVV
jgi:A/G-specific adenine glycosylase